MSGDLLPLPGFKGYFYRPSGNRNPADGAPSPIVGPNGGYLRTYRPRNGPPAVQLAGAMRPLDNLLPASPNERWATVEFAGTTFTVSTDGRVRNRNGRLLKLHTIGGASCVRINQKMVPVSTLEEHKVDQSIYLVADRAGRALFAFTRKHEARKMARSQELELSTVPLDLVDL